MCELWGRRRRSQAVAANIAAPCATAARKSDGEPIVSSAVVIRSRKAPVRGVPRWAPRPGAGTCPRSPGRSYAAGPRPGAVCPPGSRSPAPGRAPARGVLRAVRRAGLRPGSASPRRPCCAGTWTPNRASRLRPTAAISEPLGCSAVASAGWAGSPRGHGVSPAGRRGRLTAGCFVPWAACVCAPP